MGVILTPITDMLAQVSRLVGGGWENGRVSRHTTFRYQLAPTGEQERVLARHVGAARFATNQCLRLHLDARARHGQGGDGVVKVAWSGFDLINAFNAWKKTEAAGRRFVVGPDGQAQLEVTGLAWRTEVVQQVFEEAAVDVGTALRAWLDSRKGTRAGKKVGHPRFKKKPADGSGSFRVRNKHRAGSAPAIRVGDSHPRSVTLPGIGAVRVHDDTRRLRRLLAKDRGRILFATVTHRARRWWVSLNVEAADLHQAAQHPPRPDGNARGWAGVDRGLHAPVVAATSDGAETVRVTVAPKALKTGMRKQKRLARAVTRKPKGSNNRRKATARLARHHERVRNTRQHYLHGVSNLLVQTHDRLCLEDLNVTGMLTNHRLAAAITDAAWGELARQITYKQDWRHGQVVVADRWFASSKTCSACHAVRAELGLDERTYQCEECGQRIDRDLNAAVNLATWAENHARAPDGEAHCRVTNARRQERSGPHFGEGETVLDEAGTNTPHAA